MAKARVDISFKFNVFKTFLFIPAIFIGGHLAGAIGVTLGFLLVQVINTVLSYFVMIKPVLGPSYRQYMLVSLPLYLSLPTLVVSYALGVMLWPTVVGRVVGEPDSGRGAGVCANDSAVASSAGGGNKTPALSQ